MRLSRNSGFTLVESLITLALIGLALALTANLFQSALRTSLRNDGGEKFVQGLEALDDLAESLKSAKTVSSPTGSSLESRLRYEITDLNEPLGEPQTRFGHTIPAPEFLSQVEVQVIGNQLVRLTNDHTGDTFREVLVDEPEAFSVASPQPGVLELRLSFTKGKRLIAHRRLVSRYLP